MNKAILYSFRRCPYAMRARLAIAISGRHVIIREVKLRDKPQVLLDLSLKATVPVLLTPEQQLIDESLDIMFWVLKQADPDAWLSDLTPEQYAISEQLIANNDGEFKTFLDRYKYADRYPEHSAAYYRQQAEKTLAMLENHLVKNGYLISSHLTIADMSLLPFIRQFAFVDKEWFDSLPYPQLKQWLDEFIHSDIFKTIMKKHAQWHEGDPVILFPSDSNKL